MAFATGDDATPEGAQEPFGSGSAARAAHAKTLAHGFPTPADPAQPPQVGPAPTPVTPVVDMQAAMELKAGQMVDEYQVTGKLGQGGMGTVYAGIQPLIGKKVAIKVLLPEFASNPNVVSRFVQEARAVNQAHSRYIVDIFSFGRLADGRHYLVMEYLDGRSLRELLFERKQLSFDQAHPILKDIARGLSAAHSKGIVHRDLKPENVMVVEEEGELLTKLLDFGIAKLIGGSESGPTSATVTGTSMGTPYYMSPEQVRGTGVDTKSDIYAIGVMMFEILTGSRPFSAKSYIDLVNQHLFAEPPDPSTLDGSVDAELATLILKCLAKDPNERPTIDELASVLDSLTRTERDLPSPSAEPAKAEVGNEAIPPSNHGDRPERQPEPAQRKRLVWPTIVAGIILSLGVGGTTWYFSQPTPQPSGRSVTVLPVPLQQPDAPVTLWVDSKPRGSIVTVDGRPLPRPTPTSKRIAPGTYDIDLRREGYKPIEEHVELLPGRNRFLRYTLTALASDAGPPSARVGKLIVVTDVDQASYWLDDTAVGSGGRLALDSVATGIHELEIRAPGHLTASQRIRVTSNQTLTLRMKLKSAQRRRRRRARNRTPKPRMETVRSNDPDDTLNPFR